MPEIESHIEEFGRDSGRTASQDSQKMQEQETDVRPPPWAKWLEHTIAQMKVNDACHET